MTPSVQPSRDPGREPQSGAAPQPSLPSVSSRDLLAQLRRAVDFHLSGSYASAELLLRSVLRTDNELPQAHHHLAVVLHAQWQFADAVRHLETAFKLDPHQPGIADRLSRYRLDAQSSAA